MSFWPKKREINGNVSEVAVGADSQASVPAQPEHVLAEAQSRQASAELQHKQTPIASQQQLSADELQQRATDSKKRLALFGEIVSVLMRSQQFRGLSLADLETLVVPALISNQFFVVETQSKENGFVAPVGAAMWATVSAEVDQRLSTNLDQPIKLSPNEWKSGDIPWLVAAAGDARLLNPVLQKIRDTALKGSPLKLRTRDENGRVAVGTFS
jgi:hemolysin-activating ACP:hemolysin acyltransferase